MNKEFIPYEQALELKELGFDEPCFTYYFNSNGQIRTGLSIHINNGWTYSGTKRLETTLAPTFSQAFRWFREKYKIGTWIHHYFDMDKGNFQYSWIITLPYKDDGYVYETYEEAELACLEKLIEIVKNNLVDSK